jgi:BCD family chlorophyll transporter-like MFS transporter
MGQPPPRQFSLPRALKLGTFHIGSSAADLLVSAIWNRVMIVELGVAAWPVALLSALRYVLAPLSLWAGHRSDSRPLLGTRRLGYIWLGRALMLLALPLLPWSTLLLAGPAGSIAGWGLAFLSFSLFGVGTLLSGPAYLALVHDSAPYARRGQAVGVVQFMLVASFAFLPLFYARMMPAYEPAAYWRVVLTGMAVAAALWFLSVWREERPAAAPAVRTLPKPLREVLRGIWAEASTRRYALFLAASAFFAFMQDAVLEPFGGDTFGLTVGETTRFNAYWGTGVLVGMLATLAITRRRGPDQQVGTTGWGLAWMSLPLLGLGAASALLALGWVRPLLLVFGLGFGVFTVGGVSLLMAMSREHQAGTYLALWSAIQLVSRGAGIAAGGALRDLGLGLTGGFPGAYALVFWAEGLGVLGCIALLRWVDVAGFAAGRQPLDAAEAWAGAD